MDDSSVQHGKDEAQLPLKAQSGVMCLVAVPTGLG